MDTYSENNSITTDKILTMDELGIGLRTEEINPITFGTEYREKYCKLVNSEDCSEEMSCIDVRYAAMMPIRVVVGFYSGFDNENTPSDEEIVGMTTPSCYWTKDDSVEETIKNVNALIRLEKPLIVFFKIGYRKEDGSTKRRYKIVEFKDCFGNKYCSFKDARDTMLKYIDR